MSISDLQKTYYNTRYGVYRSWNGIKGGIFYLLNTNSYLVKFNSKSKFKTTKLRWEKFANTSLAYFSSSLTLIGCRFGQVWLRFDLHRSPLNLFSCKLSLIDIISINNRAIVRCLRQPCPKWHPVKVRQLINFDTSPFGPAMSAFS